MKLEKFKQRDHKKTGIIVFTIACVLLVAVAILYRTFAIFEVKTNQNIINGNVQTGDILFTFYKEDEDGNYVITDTIPEEDYVLNSSESYCGVAGRKDEKIIVSMDSIQTLEITGLSNPSTKCKLYFEKWKSPFANPKETIDKAGNGLYEVDHKNDGDGLGAEWKAKPEWRYAGPDPNNYVWFNDELWRIIGLVNVLVIQPDGSKQVEQRLKIIRDKIEYAGWNDDNYNDWTNASLMKDFNEEGGEFYQSLTEDAKKMIDSNIIWNLGGISGDSSSEDYYKKLKANEFYKKERGTTGGGAAPATTEWPMPEGEKYTPGTALVGLMYPSDYGYATGGTNRENCLKSTELYNYATCSESDWLFKEEEWLLSPNSSNSINAFILCEDGYILNSYDYVDHYFAVRPVVYLTSKVKISGGIGKGGIPYTLKAE